ncbi:hypothetical protein [Spirosoma sp.]|uniref:hypothetical protein n=1 Tax=Spirosoma sp. TaxID=1899569 RepID=UPI002605C674|nr:hypothetical protein [Spirosoma sp.]MCX6217573.1 hypothetical protein [Spirosoma sp.]
MNIDTDYIKDVWEIIAKNNGDAYRNGKNVPQAVAKARAQLVLEFVQALNELVPEMEQAVYAKWYCDEIEEALTAELHSFKKAPMLLEGVEVSERCYDFWLNEMLPIRHRPGSFFFAEPLAHTADNLPIHWYFWQEGGKYWVKETALPKQYRAWTEPTATPV